MFFVLGGQYVCIINIELPLFRVYPIKIYGTVQQIVATWYNSIYKTGAMSRVQTLG